MMAQSQVMEGTTEEITTLLHSGVFAGRRVRVIVEPDGEDYTNILVDPPNTVRDGTHMEELLVQGLSSPKREMTDADWNELKRRAYQRIEGRTP
jgi:hypothetical protein